MVHGCGWTGKLISLLTVVTIDLLLHVGDAEKFPQLPGLKSLTVFVVVVVVVVVAFQSASMVLSLIHI